VSDVTEPRLAPLPASDWTAGDRDRLRGRLAVTDRYLTGEPDAPPMPAILGLLAHHPDLAANWLTLSGGLLDDAVLDARDRELLVLRVAWRTQSRYEWAQHVRIGRDAGLADDEIASLAAAEVAGQWSDRDGCLIAAADEMIEQHGVGDATWRGLAAHFDEQELLELLFVVGSYVCLALVLNSTGLEPDQGTDEGLARLPTLEAQS
jgi:alkylhydroperoxidase family enzyme